MFEVTMPQLGETVADGTVAKWFKKVGDVVTRGEPLFEVSSDKADVEIPAQADGILRVILVAEGVTVDVGTVLARIGGESEQIAIDEPVGPASMTSLSRGDVVAKGHLVTRSKDGGARLSPVVRRLLSENGLDVSQIEGSGPNGRVTREDVLHFVELTKRQAKTRADSFTSPVVRRLLESHQIDPASITGSGPNGRLTRSDVEGAIAGGVGALATRTGDEIVPFTRIRRITAEHMLRSKATSAHTLMVREVDYEKIEKVRRHFGEEFKVQEGFGLTYLPFNAMAVLDALHEYPHLNSSVGNDELVVHHDLNLGVAVNLDLDGLVVPVIRGADRYGLRVIARKIHDVATRARSKKLTVDDLSGGTFTITNPGPFGTLITGAVINQPQVAILSTDGIKRKPVVITSTDGEESVAIHSVGLLALNFDHRAVDGAYAARFLSRVDEILNSRNWQSELV